MGHSRVSLNEEQNDGETDDAAAAAVVVNLSMNALYTSVSVLLTGPAGFVKLQRVETQSRLQFWRLMSSTQK